MRGGNLERRHLTVADLEELENLGASEIHARRLIAKEVIPPSQPQMEQLNYFGEIRF